MAGPQINTMESQDEEAQHVESDTAKFRKEMEDSDKQMDIDHNNILVDTEENDTANGEASQIHQ